jgi:hypothetical protein
MCRQINWSYKKKFNENNAPVYRSTRGSETVVEGIDARAAATWRCARRGCRGGLTAVTQEDDGGRQGTLDRRRDLDRLVVRTGASEDRWMVAPWCDE